MNSESFAIAGLESSRVRRGSAGNKLPAQGTHLCSKMLKAQMSPMPISTLLSRCSVSTGDDGLLEGVGREAGHQNYLLSGIPLNALLAYTCHPITGMPSHFSSPLLQLMKTTAFKALIFGRRKSQWEQQVLLH